MSVLLDKGTKMADKYVNEGVRWLHSFLSADKRKTYCLYEAPSAEAIRRAAARAGLPADVVVEMTATVHADGSLVPF